MRFCLRACIALAALLTACGEKPPPADAVFLNGSIYTLAGEPPQSPAAEPRVEALAVRAGRIVATGTSAAMRRHVGPSTRVHDLAVRTVVPGLVDCHVHMHSLGGSLRQVDLVGTQSYTEVIACIAAQAAQQPAGSWVLGRGWDQNDWPAARFPDHAELSRAVPAHPVFVRRVDGHAGLANAAALQAAGIEAQSADPDGGRIVRRDDGAPAGVLVDRAMDLVTPIIPPPSPEERLLRLRLALAHAAEQGLTGVHDAGIDLADYQDYSTLLVNGELPLRVYAMVGGTRGADVAAGQRRSGETSAATPTATLLELAQRDGPHPFDPTQRLALRCVKLMVDGALGSRGAALLEPYSDEPGSRGLSQYTLEDFLELARPLHDSGFQLATHAIGDAGNRLVLDAYETLQREMPRAEVRHRVEHAQVLAPADIQRFATLGVLPSMQPTHCTSDMPWAGVRLGSEREAGAYAWRSLRDTGVRIAAGSDAPVESIAPLLGLYAAVTRQDAGGQPEGGWHPEQRLGRSEALRAFTSWAAYAGFSEADLGTLETGKLADLTVFDHDVVQCEAARLLDTRVMLTVVGGDVVFERDAARTAR